MQIQMQHIEHVQIAKDDMSTSGCSDNVCFGYMHRIKGKMSEAELCFEDTSRNKREKVKESRETKGGR